MKNFTRIFIIVFTGVLFQSSSKSQPEASLNGWYKMGSKPDSYEIGLSTDKYNDGPVYYMKSIEASIDGFGTIAKNIEPGIYKNKRVRLSGFIKTENIEGWVGMWMRVDAFEQGKMLGFDNMGNRPIKGTNDWQKYEIVLDVPEKSAGIFYGVLAFKTGEVWITELSMEIVGDDVPTTNMLTEPPENVTGDYSELPPEIKNIPNGIEVGHNPQTVYATFSKKDTMYYWVYKTSVKPMSEDIEITEFGAYTWYSDHWEFSTVTGKPFNNKDFADWYKCKNGMMKKGKEYSDKKNWNKSPTLQKGKALWYYKGKNKKGELFKGTAIVDYLPELKKK